MITNLFSTWYRKLLARKSLTRRPMQNRLPELDSKPQLETLEDRVMPTATAFFGGLEFTTAGTFSTNGTQMSASAPVLVGVAPQPGSVFVPELQLNGGVSFDTADTTGAFSTAGSVNAVFGNQNLALLDAQAHVFSAPGLLSNSGFTLPAGDTNLAWVPVVGGAFTATNLHLTPTELDLQGTLTFRQLPGLFVQRPGLTLPVTGADHVAIDATGVHLSSLDTDITSPQSINSALIDFTFNNDHVHFDTAKQEFDLSGPATAWQDYNSQVPFSLGTSNAPNVTITNGGLQTYSPAVIAQALEQVYTSPSTVGNILKIDFHQTEVQVAEALQGSGVGATGVAQVLKTDFVGNPLPQAAGYTDSAIEAATALQAAFPNMTMQQLTQSLHDAGYAAVETGLALENVFFQTGPQIAQALHDSGYAAADLPLALSESGYYESQTQVVQTLHDVGYNLTQIVSALIADYDVSAQQAIQLLAGVTIPVPATQGLVSTPNPYAYTIVQIGTAVKSVFDVSAQDMTKDLGGVGYALGDIIQVLQNAYAETSLQTTQILLGAGYTTSQVGPSLGIAYGLTVPQVVQNLHDVGYSVTAIATALQASFSETAMQTAQILKGVTIANPNTSGSYSYGYLYVAGYTSSDVANVLKSVYGETDTQAAQILQSVGYSANDVAAALRTVYGDSDARTAQVMHDAGFSITAIGTAIKTVYGDSATQTAQVLMTVVPTNPNAAGPYYNSYNYSRAFTISDIATVLNSVYNESALQSVQLLQSLSVTVANIGTALQGVYGQTDVQTAQTLHDAGYSVNDIASVLKNVYQDSASQTVRSLLGVTQTVTFTLFGWYTYSYAIAVYSFTVPQVVGLLQQLGYGASDIGSVLLSVYGQSASQTAQTLHDANYSITDIAASLKTAYNLNGVQTAQTLQGVTQTVTYSFYGWTFSYTIAAYGETAGQMAQLLQSVGYGASDVGSMLLTVFGQSAQQTAQSLHDVGYSIIDMATALKNVYSVSSAQNAAILQGVTQLWSFTVAGWTYSYSTLAYSSSQIAVNLASIYVPATSPAAPRNSPA